MKVSFLQCRTLGQSKLSTTVTMWQLSIVPVNLLGHQYPSSHHQKQVELHLSLWINVLINFVFWDSISSSVGYNVYPHLASWLDVGERVDYPPQKPGFWRSNSTRESIFFFFFSIVRLDSLGDAARVVPTDETTVKFMKSLLSEASLAMHRMAHYHIRFIVHSFLLRAATQTSFQFPPVVVR